jgi:hypothetical protein
VGSQELRDVVHAPYLTVTVIQNLKTIDCTRKPAHSSGSPFPFGRETRSSRPAAPPREFQQRGKRHAGQLRFVWMKVSPVKWASALVRWGRGRCCVFELRSCLCRPRWGR